MTQTTRSRSLAIEFILLFVGLPLAVVAAEKAGLVRVPLIPALWALSLVAAVALWRDRTFPRERFFRIQQWREHLLGPLLRFGVCVVLLTLVTALFFPERLFGFIEERPALWTLVMVLYPFLSVYPQGLIFRGWLMHRYRRLFPTPRGLAAASAFGFAAAHLVLQNGIAFTFTLVGGWFFARTYQRSGSLLIAAVEHSLYGQFLFTIGLGWYFYGGAR